MERNRSFEKFRIARQAPCEGQFLYFSKNSSTEILASFYAPLTVPSASSLWSGTIVPMSSASVFFFNTIWLPFCLACSKPNFFKTLISSLPESLGSFGIYLSCESGQEYRLGIFHMKFFEIKFCGFFQIF